MKDHVGAESLDGANLIGIASVGDNDNGAHAKKPRGVGDGLTVIPGGRRDDAALFLFGGEAGDEIDPSAHLEGPNRLVILVLDVNGGSEKLG